MIRISGAWLSASATQTVLGMLNEAGFEAYAVGGCVRDALLGEPVGDVDLSTNARPEQVMALAENMGLKAIPTGIDHGTVTVLAEGQGFEITTWRADVQTDGRRAVVAFADDIALDAVRRDFTMNALYADRHGQVIDPLGGIDDLRARRLRFIQDAETRIREDYLRVLRYFRFFAWYGDPSEGLDPEALAAIAETLDGLETLSRERVGSEIMRLLSAPDPLMAVSAMAQCGALIRLLPGAEVKALGPLLHHEASLSLKPDPLRRLAALGVYDGRALRLPKGAIKRLQQDQTEIGSMQGLAALAWRLGADRATDLAVLRAALLEMPLAPDTRDQIAMGAKACFPLSAQDLMPGLRGAALGAELDRLKTLWIASGFGLDRDALLAEVRS